MESGFSDWVASFGSGHRSAAVIGQSGRRLAVRAEGSSQGSQGSVHLVRVDRVDREFEYLSPAAADLTNAAVTYSGGTPPSVFLCAGARWNI